MIERLVAWITELEALVGKPRKTSVNLHIPPSKDGIGRDRKRRKLSGGPRPAREGKTRPLSETPDKPVPSRSRGPNAGLQMPAVIAGRMCPAPPSAAGIATIISTCPRSDRSQRGWNCSVVAAGAVADATAPRLRQGCSRVRRSGPASLAAGLPAPQPSCRVRASVAACGRDVRPDHLRRRYRQHLQAHGSGHGHRDERNP